MTDKPLDFGNAYTGYTDDLSIIERHGPVTHLLFTTEQRDYYQNRNTKVITARLIVPTVLLESIGRQLIEPQRVIVDADTNEAAVVH